MWRKGDSPDQDPTPGQVGQATGAATGAAKGAATGTAAEASAGEPPHPASRPGGQATIGRSITIRGEVSGDEDLVIEGRVDGSVTLGQHAVTVGPDGKVKAQITARVVTVEGRVEGDLTGEEQVVLRTSAWVEGDVAAPRVVLEDGAHFKGGVDMGRVAVAGAASSGKDAGKPQNAKPESKPEGKSEPARTPVGAGQSSGSQGNGGAVKAGIKG
jgi:cytoskeletal protein CcmA (bactofilin family)